MGKSLGHQIDCLVTFTLALCDLSSNITQPTLPYIFLVSINKVPVIYCSQFSSFSSVFYLSFWKQLLRSDLERNKLCQIYKCLRHVVFYSSISKTPSGVEGPSTHTYMHIDTLRCTHRHIDIP